MKNNSSSTPTPLLSHVFVPNLSLVLPQCLPKLSKLIGIKNLQIGKGGFPACQQHKGAISSCTGNKDGTETLFSLGTSSFPDFWLGMQSV